LLEKKVHGILVTHASLGAELLHTAETILGPQTEIDVISNSRSSSENLLSRIGKLLETDPDRPAFLFVDLFGGSCGYTCQEIRRRYPNTVVFFGVNLPMFLEFLHHRHRVTLGELKERLIQKGRDGIQCLS